ncbi:hypothetical protein D1AOALGA4SA_2174 [Olavius algarvensis Delta 1 endosymbiont]|nr:hypothetical protein D1AOALGA4SA_2174 [Olavius algarvensis Delta 1 endosymbiont]
MYSQLLIRYLDLFLFTAELAESAEKNKYWAGRAGKTKKISWSRAVSDIISACSHRGVGLRPYGFRLVE